MRKERILAVSGTHGCKRLAGPLALLLCLVANAFAGDAPASTSPATPAKPAEKSARRDFYFITDYLPPALYDGDNFSACFRIENTTLGESSLQLQVTCFDGAGKAVRETKEKVTAAKGFTSCQTTQETNGASRVEYALKNGSETIGAVTVRLLRQTESWPATKVEQGRLVSEDGQVLVPLVGKRLKLVDRAFAPIKWLVGDKNAGKAKKLENAWVLAALPGRWKLDLKRNDVIELGPYEANGMLPVVAALGEVLTELEKHRAANATRPLDRAVVAFPPEDLEVATDPRVYRIVVEVLLARLQAAGVKETILIPPIHFGIKDKYLQAIHGEVMKAAGLYLAQAVDPSEYLQEKLWRVDPNEEGVYGIRPNADGLQKLQQALLDLLP